MVRVTKLSLKVVWDSYAYRFPFTRGIKVPVGTSVVLQSEYKSPLPSRDLWRDSESGIWSEEEKTPGVP